MLTRESFLKAAAPGRLEAFEAPDVGKVYLRVLTLAELGPVVKRQEAEPTGSLKGAAILVAATLCDKDRKALFDVSSHVDIEALCDLPFSLIRAISDAAAKVNGLGETAVKDAEKN